MFDIPILRKQTPENNQRLSIYLLTAFPTHAYFFTVVEFQHFYAHRIDAFIAHQHHVGPVNWGFTFNDSALPVLCGRTRMPFYDIDVFNKYALLFPVDFKHFAYFTVIFSGDDLDFVILF
jgi:hypothetical protein